MKAAALLCVVAICMGPASADTDPLVPFFTEQLDDLLKQASGSWPDTLTIKDVQANLVKGGHGWLSFREAQLYNLSSWSLSGDVTVKCDADPATVTANISFQPLMVTLSYLFDNGTALHASRQLSVTYNNLAAQLVIDVDVNKVSASLNKFNLNYASASVNVGDASLDNVKKEDVVTALGRELSTKALGPVQNSIGTIIDKTVSTLGWTAITQACPTTTTVPTTPTSPPTPSPTTPSPTTTSPPTPPTTTSPPTPPTTTSPPTPPTTTSPTSPTTTSPPTPPKSSPSTSSTPTTSPKGASSKATTPSASGSGASSSGASSSGASGFRDSRSGASGSPTDRIKLMNNLIDSLLNKTSENFTGQNLLPYKLPDSDQELYQSEDGTATLQVSLAGLRSLAVSGDPHVMSMEKILMVTADVGFSNLTYSVQLVSAGSTWTVEGNVTQLTGQLMLNVDWQNTSAANASFQGFQLRPFVSLTGKPTLATSTARADPDDSEIVDAVKGVFRSTVVSQLQAAASDPVKKVADSRTWDLEPALATTQAPIPSTTASAPPLGLSRVWAVSLALALAAKMLL